MVRTGWYREVKVKSEESQEVRAVQSLDRVWLASVPPFVGNQIKKPREVSPRG
jgi:hypothetical protein